MRFVLIFVLLCVPFAFGAGISAQSPADNATVDVTTEKFTFTADQEYRDTEIDSCGLVVDDETVKTLVIRDKLGGQSRHFTLDVDPGRYEWRVTCQIGEKTVRSDPRIVNVIPPLRSAVDVRSSGVTRGSLIHEFEIENTPEQDPIFVPRVAPGDFINIILSAPPSTFTKEFFIQSRRVQDGRTYIVAKLEQETYDLYEGENATITLGTETIIGGFVGMDGTRMNFMFWPDIKREEPVEEEPPAEPEEPVEEEPEEPDTPPSPVEPEPIVEPEQPEPDTPKARQGFFSWLVSLLSGLFGT